MYDPTLGRFLQREPVERITGGANAYLYVGANPTNDRDPSGKAIWTWGACARANLPQLPGGCRVIRGNARWLWCYVTNGWPVPISGSLAAAGVMSGCDLTDAQIAAITALCNQRAGLQRQLDCVMSEIRRLVSRANNVCRHFARCFKKVWENMGGTQTYMPRMVGLEGHAWNQVPDPTGGTYYVDAFNDIMFWCP